MVFDTVLAFDHVQHRILIIANARITPDDDLEALYQFACTKIDFLERELRRDLSHPHAGPAPTRGDIECAARAVRGDGQDGEGVHRGRRHLSGRAVAALRSGDQRRSVHRLSRAAARQPVAVHVLPPDGRVSIVGASPEMLVRVEGRRWRRRIRLPARVRAGETEEEDQRLAEELSATRRSAPSTSCWSTSGRNDVGRVSQSGTVRVPTVHGDRALLARDAPGVERRGKLADDQDRLDALVACFPAGTVSGAPKMRAMEIIAELEPDRRGVYAGAVGYLDFAGNIDSASPSARS